MTMMSKVINIKHDSMTTITPLAILKHLLTQPKKYLRSLEKIVPIMKNLKQYLAVLLLLQKLSSLLEFLQKNKRKEINFIHHFSQINN